MKTLALFIIALNIFVLEASAQRGYSERIKQNFLNTDTNTVMVVCHRGCWRMSPENSISSIENAIRIGADMVEIDVRRSKDGVLVLMHDASVNRTTNGSGNVSDLTLSQLKALRLKDLANGGGVTNEQIPTLEEALKVSKNHIMLNLDSKVDIADVYPILVSVGVVDQVLIKETYNLANTITFVKNLPGPIFFMPVLAQQSDTAEINGFMDSLNIQAFELCFNAESNALINNQSFNKYNNGNVRIWVNTLWNSLCAGHTDDKSLTDPDNNWGWMLNKGFNMIQTDRPEELLDYLRKRNQHRLLLDIVTYNDTIIGIGNGEFKVGGLKNGDYLWYESDTSKNYISGQHDSTLTRYLKTNATMWVSCKSDSGFSRVPVSVMVVDTSITQKAMNFDGSNKVSIAHSTLGNPSGAFSASCWVKVDVNSGYQSIITKHGRVGGNPTGFALEYNPNDYLQANIGNNSSWQTIKGPKWNKGEWHHIALTFDGSKMELFQDGVSLGSTNASFYGNTYDFTIGASYYYPSNVLKGSIDEVAYWSKALTQQEIKDMMHKELQGNEANLLLCYNFNRVSNGKFIDLSPSKYDGTITGKASLISSTAPVTTLGNNYKSNIKGSWSVSPNNDTVAGLGIKSNFNYNQAIVFGNNNKTGMSKVSVPDSVEQRLAKEWHFYTIDNQATDLSFNLSEAGVSKTDTAGLNNTPYLLLYRANISDIFQVVDTFDIIEDENIKFSNFLIKNGFYTLANPILKDTTTTDTIPTDTIPTDTTSILDINDLQKIRLFPNPSEDMITLEFSDNVDLGSIVAVLYGITGKKVSVPISRYTNKFIIDGSALARGIYIIELRKFNSVIVREKVLLK